MYLLSAWSQPLEHCSFSYHLLHVSTVFDHHRVDFTRKECTGGSAPSQHFTVIILAVKGVEHKPEVLFIDNLGTTWRGKVSFTHQMFHNAVRVPPLAIGPHIHTHIHTYIYTYIHSYIHTYIHTYIHIYILTYIHTYIHTYIYIHTFIHACINIYMRT
jgi:hypothetical protein